MKLYFYKLEKGGIEVAEAECKSMTSSLIGEYYETLSGANFPNSLYHVRKCEIDKLTNLHDYLILAEPNFAKAKEEFKSFAERHIKWTFEELKELEKHLKIIEESEE